MREVVNSGYGEIYYDQIRPAWRIKAWLCDAKLYDYEIKLAEGIIGTWSREKK